MKRKFFTSLLLAILSISMVLASCSKAGEKGKPVDPETPRGGQMENPEDILDPMDFNPDNPINYDDKAYYYSDHINDVESNFVLTLSANPTYTSVEASSALNTVKDNLNDHVRIYNTKKELVNLTATIQPHGIDITPENEIYKAGKVYTAHILSNEVCFKDKDPRIKKLYFDVKRPDTFKQEIHDDLKYFNINKVVQFANDEYVELDPASPEAAQWFQDQTYEMIYATDELSSLKAGYNFCITPFKGGKPELDEKNSFFGKFVSSTKVSNGYKVVYKNADLTEIYKDKNNNVMFDVHANEAPVTEFRDVKVRFSEDRFKECLKQDPQFLRLAQAILMATGNEDNATKYDILTSINADFSIAWNAPKLVIQVKASANVPINKDKTAALYFEFTYQYTSEFSASGSVEVEKFLGIPYWIEAKSECTQAITHKFGLKVALMRNFKPDEVDTSDMKKMIKNAYDKLENDPAYFMDRSDDDAKTSANERLFPICELNFPFGGIFSFYISLDIHLTMDLRVLFEWNYVNQHTERVLSFSTSDGVENTSNTDKISADCHQIDIMGQIGFQLGGLLKGGLCITGLSKLFGLGFSAEGGVYVDFKGMVGLTWGGDEGVRFVGGVDFDFGIYGQLSAFIDFLCFHPKYDFVKGKLSIIGYEKEYTVIELFAPDSVEMSGPTLDISDTTMLTCQVFSVGEMKVDIVTFQTNSTVKVKEGTTVTYPNPMSIEIPEDCHYVSVDKENNKLVLADDVPPEFSVDLTVKVDESLTYLLDTGDPLTHKVKLHYKSPNAHSVTIKGTSVEKEEERSLLVDQGKKITLPYGNGDHEGMSEKYTCELKYDEHFNVVPGELNYDDTYYDFIGWTDGKNNYAPGDKITVGDKDIVLTPVFKIIIYHTATFYNGNNEVIFVSRVREFTSAEAPSMEQIMWHMDGYTFYGWNRTFDYMTEDINVYGIYYKAEVK